MSAGCLFDEGCCNCDGDWKVIGTIKPDNDGGTMPKPNNSLDWIKERLTEQAYRGYLVGKIHECLYSYLNAGHHEADLDCIGIYLRLLEND